MNVNRGGGVKVQVGGGAELACAMEVSVDGGPAVEIRVDKGASTPLQAVISTASKINNRPTSFRYQRNTTLEFCKLPTPPFFPSAKTTFECTHQAEKNGLICVIIV